MKMNNKNKMYNIVLIAMVLISLIGTVFIYNRLPDKVPSSWDMKGEVTAFQHKLFVYFTAILPLVMYGLLKFLPKVDPKRESYVKHRKAYEAVVSVIIVFLILMHWITIVYSLDYDINVTAFIQILIGIMFLVMGNYMPQIRHNYFLGIKTPWTLASEAVWKKTHMVGGYIFFLIGLIFMINGFIFTKTSFYITIGLTLVSTIGLTVYSYLLYKKEK